MDTITHFSHEHPLHLLKQKPTEAGKVCYACDVPVINESEHLAELYGCELCEKFFLHKHCAQLPMEIVHKLHQNHSLFLVLKPTNESFCNFCWCEQQPCEALSSTRCFFYRCYLCNFILQPDCAFRKKESVVLCKKELLFHHSSHNHQLLVQPKPASFLCDACGVKNEDLSYHCTPCHYWIHKRCAMLPSTTLSDIHDHLLTLSFGLPSQYDNFFEFQCDIFEDSLWREGESWLYYCELCRYFVHIRCMDKKKKKIEVDLKGLLIDDLLCLPTNEKSVELIRRCLLKNKDFSNNQPEIQVSGHKHPLLYSNDPFPEDFIIDGEEIMCDACIDPIFSPPYYHCAECRYFLHLSCAKLPQQLQLQHPIHSHQLILDSEKKFHEMFTCNRCDRHSNGFFFYCTTDGCEFYLDLKCAALPNVIIHDNHNHPLFHTIREYMKTCRGCGHTAYNRPWMACEPCEYYLHVKCGLLPKTIKNRFDSKHSLTLRYPPHAYHPKPFDCYECENEINPNYWLYHCEECDLSFHVHCINHAWEYRKNIKFGQKVQIGCHQHPLKYVNEPSVEYSKCHYCKKVMPQYPNNFSLECETCNFRLCEACVKEIDSPSHGRRYKRPSVKIYQ